MAKRRNINEDELRNLWAQGVRMVDLAKHFQMSVAGIQRRAMAAGCPRRNYDTTKLPARAIEMAYVVNQKTGDEIAAEIGCSREAIMACLKSRKVTLRPAKKRCKDLRKEIAALAKTGMYYKDIGARLGLREAQVQTRAKRMGIHRGCGHFSRAPLEELIRLKNEGLSYSQIGLQFGLARSSVSNRFRGARARGIHV